MNRSLKCEKFLFILYIIMPLIIMVINYCKLNINVLNFWYIAVFLVLIYTLIIFKNNYRKFFSIKYLPLFLLILVFFITSILAKDSQLAFWGSEYRREGFLTYIAYLGYIYMGYQVKDFSELKKYLNLMLGVCLIICGILLTKSSFAYRVFNLRDFDFYYAGPFSHFNHFGYYLLINCLLATYLFYQQKGIGKIGYGMITILFIFMLIINDTLGSILSYLLITVIFIIGLLIRHKHYLSLVWLGILCLIGGVLLYFKTSIIQNNFNNLWLDTQKIVQSIKQKDETLIYDIGTERGKLWLLGFKIFAKKPIFGYGLENIASEYAAYNMYQTRPHNFILEMLMSVGLIGTILLFYNLGRIIIAKLKQIKTLKTSSCLALYVVIGYLINLMFGNSMFYTSAYFYFFLGVLMHKEGSNES